MILTTAVLALSTSVTAQPLREPVPMIADVPLMQVMLSVHVQRAPSADWFDGRTVRDRDGEAVKAQGYVTGPRVYIGEHIALTNRETEQGEPHRELESLSRPKILVLSGQDAEIAIGEQAIYAQLDEDGETMRLVEDERYYEGLSIETNPVALDHGGVRFDRLDIALRRVVGRMDVANASGTHTVALPAGRPIVQTTMYSLPIVLPEGERAVVVLTPEEGEGESFVITIEATVVTPDE